MVPTKMSLTSRIRTSLVKNAALRGFLQSSLYGTSDPKMASRVAVPAAVRRNYCAATKFETLDVTSPSEYVVKVQLNRPEKSNAMNHAFWREIQQCFEELSSDSSCRVVLLTGSGKNYSAGLDIIDFAQDFFSNTSSDDGADVARKTFNMKKVVKSMQDSFTALEKCPKPVIAVVQGACVGGGVDMISACDVRYCTSDAFFQIKEVDLGLMADVGTIQRLPKLIGNASLLRELIYTARKFTADEALKLGMVSGVYESKESAESAALSLANEIASKSPVAVQGSKVNLNYSRDHPVDDALEYAAVWNSAMLQSEDILKAVQANVQKEKPIFAKL